VDELQLPEAARGNITVEGQGEFYSAGGGLVAGNADPATPAQGRATFVCGQESRRLVAKEA
jgi:hypothetical protein